MLNINFLLDSINNNKKPLSIKIDLIFSNYLCPLIIYPYIHTQPSNVLQSFWFVNYINSYMDYLSIQIKIAPKLIKITTKM